MQLKTRMAYGLIRMYDYDKCLLIDAPMLCALCCLLTASLGTAGVCELDVDQLCAVTVKKINSFKV